MEKEETNLLDCYIVRPKRFGDDRGYFESVTIEQMKELGFQDFMQLNHSKSGKGTVRGLHFQHDPYCQAKLVTCMNGGVIDVVVDLRSDSPSYGDYTSVLLTPENGNMLYVPRGFAHGFIALHDNTLFEYYVDNKYEPKSEDGILWNDPSLGIPWDKWFYEYNIEKPILSNKDAVRSPLDRNKVLFKR